MSTVNIALMFQAVTTLFGLPEGLLSSMCYVESNHNIYAYHPKDGQGDSLGICQVKLKTARHQGFKGTPKELMEPFTNIYYAGQYLQKHIGRYKSIKKAIVAYNLGHYTPRYKKYYNKVRIAYNEGR